MIDATSLADQKLQLEIEEMRKSPLKKFSTYTLWVPVVLGVWSLYSDYVDFKGWREKADNFEQQYSDLGEQVSGAVSSLAATKTDIDAFVILADDYAEEYGVIKTADGADRYATLTAQLENISGTIEMTSADLRKLVTESTPDRQ